MQKLLSINNAIFEGVTPFSLAKLLTNVVPPSSG